MTHAEGPLTIEKLRTLVDAGTIDTVLIAITDMQGRLQGKRCGARYFLDEVVAARGRGLQLPARGRRGHEHRRRLRDVLLGERLRRLRASSPTSSTLRLMPWHEGTALVLCDLQWDDGRRCVASPRQILRKQLERLAERGLVAYVGTELEFMLFNDAFEAAWDKGYRGCSPPTSTTSTTRCSAPRRVEPLLRRIRNGMTGAGMYVESAKGECNLGQHEIAFRYADALTTCDNHSIYKTGAKEIAARPTA